MSRLRHCFLWSHSLLPMNLTNIVRTIQKGHSCYSAHLPNPYKQLCLCKLRLTAEGVKIDYTQNTTNHKEKPQ